MTNSKNLRDVKTCLNCKHSKSYDEYDYFHIYCLKDYKMPDADEMCRQINEKLKKECFGTEELSGIPYEQIVEEYLECCSEGLEVAVSMVCDFHEDKDEANGN